MHQNTQMARGWFAGMLVLAPGLALAQDVGTIEAFTEPHRILNLAAAESGIIHELNVEEGDAVAEGEVLAVLDHDILLVSLELAKLELASKGRLEMARAEQRLKQTRLARLDHLRKNGNATQQEVDQARTEAEIARAKLLIVEEEIEQKRIEHQRIKVQIERRKIRSPIDGVVTRILKRRGEFATGTDPVILTVVQLNPLVATFSIPSGDVANLNAGQTIDVNITNVQGPVQGEITLIAPVTNAESGTVGVKIRIDNAEGKYRSGERCSINMPAKTAKVPGAPTR